MKKLKLGQRGFTIVELLIVIVIIGILATIGFVAFSGAQNKAKKSKAESTLAQTKSKLGEYYAANNTYPADKGAVKTFLEGNEGGNNDTLSATLGEADEDIPYGYACATTCEEGFTLTANSEDWGGTSPTDDLQVTN